MPGGRPTKPLALVEGHRTKKEKKIRQDAENALMTGVELKESDNVSSNFLAHKEFLRIKELLRSINKDDDLSGNIINSHCLLVAECIEIEEVKERFIKNLDEFEDRVSSEKITFSEEMKIRMNMQNQILGCDKALMGKRKMLLDIGKENILTIQSALRSIPKKEEPKGESKMASFLKKKQSG